MKTVLLFDFDGTLADSIPVVVDSFRDAFRELSAPYPGDDAIRAQIGKHLQDIFSDFLPEKSVEKAVKAYRKHYLARQNRGGIHLFPGVRDAISSLAQKGYQMGVVTTKLAAFTQPLLDNLSLSPYFSCLVGAEDVTHCKPHPEPLLLASKRMNVSPDACAYIGDSVHDAQAATAANMTFMGVLTGAASINQLQQYGRVFADIREMEKIL